MSDRFEGKRVQTELGGAEVTGNGTLVQQQTPGNRHSEMEISAFPMKLEILGTLGVKVQCWQPRLQEGCSAN